MKRDFLESLNIDKDAVDAIMAESGKGVEKLKERISELEALVSSFEALKEENLGLISEKDNAISEANRLSDRLCASEKRHINEKLARRGIKSGLADYITDCIFNDISITDDNELDAEKLVSDFSEKYPQLFDTGLKPDGMPFPTFSKRIEDTARAEEPFASRFGYLKRS